MADIGGFKPETAQLILAVVKYLRDSGFVIPPKGQGQANYPPETPIFFRNDSGEVVPPFACMQATGTVESGGQNYITIDKPTDTSGTAGGYLFNSISEVEIDGYGMAYEGPFVRMLTDGSTVTCGEKWQPTVAAWTVEPGGSLFSAVGADDIETDVMRAFVGATGTSGQIQYTIDSLATASSGPYIGLVVATVTVTVASPGYETLIGTSVEVVDHSGCIFDKTEEELAGAWGWGVWATADSLDNPGTLAPFHWATDDRCCVAADSSGGSDEVYLSDSEPPNTSYKLWGNTTGL